MRERGISWPWPSNSDVEALVEKAGGLFLSAVKIVNFIDDGTNVPHRKLTAALRANTPRRSFSSVGDVRAERLWINTSDDSFEAVALEGLIDNLILPCVSISLKLYHLSN